MSELNADRLPQSITLKDQALAILRQAVVSGEIEPGGMYSASALAKQLGISLSPAREAMLTLVHEGIFEPVKNRGFKVVTIDENDLCEIVELRTLLEVPAVVGLCRIDITPWCSKLRDLATQIEVAAQEGDICAFLHRDRDFHLTLLQIAGNSRLVDHVARLRDQTRLYGLHKLAYNSVLKYSAREHMLILQAIRAKDRSRVRNLMHSHLEHIQHDWATGTMTKSNCRREGSTQTEK